MISAPLKPSQGQHLLGLPPELLLHIIQYATPDDLVSLRLCCRVLKAAAHDMFVDEFFATSKAFILDPRRTQRLAAILATKHIIGRVREVILTMQVYESANADIEFAHSLAGDEPQEKISIETYKELGASCVDWSSIASITKSLSNYDNISLRLLLVGEEETGGILGAAYNQIVCQLVGLAVIDDCRIWSLTLTEDFVPKGPSLFQMLTPYLPTLQTELGSLGYVCSPTKPEHLQSRRLSETMSLYWHLLDHSACLKEIYLKVYMMDKFATNFRLHCPDMARLNTSLLTTERQESLTILTLDSLDMVSRDFWALAKQSGDSIRSLILVDLCIDEAGNAWMRIFEALQTMRALNKLSVEDVAMCDPATTDVEILDALFKDPRQNLNKRYHVVRRCDAQQLIELNLKDGITYTAEFN